MICCFSAKTSLTASPLRRSSYDDLGKDIFRLAQRQPEGGLQQTLASGGVQFDLHLLELAHVRDDFIQQLVEIIMRGQRIT